jgi:hypothetical protein
MMSEVTHLRADQEIGKRIWWDEFYHLDCCRDWFEHDEYFSQAAEPLTAQEAADCEVILVCDACGGDMLPIVYTID